MELERSMPMLSSRQGITLFVLSFQCLLFTGVTFGWSSLQILLTSEGSYSCSGDSASDDGDGSCKRQVLDFSLAYTVASFCHVISALPVGFMMDSESIGVNGTSALGCLMLGVGFFLLALAVSSSGGDEFVLPGVLAIGAGGPTVFFPLLRRAQEFPGWENQVITLMNTLFDASAAVYGVALIVHKQSSVPSTFVFGALGATAFLSMPANTLIASKLLKPPSPSPPPQKQPQVQIQGVVELKTLEPPPIDVAPQGKEEKNGGSGGEESPIPLSQLVFTLRFAALCLFISVHMLRSNAYLGTVGDALASRERGERGDEDEDDADVNKDDDDSRRESKSERAVLILAFMLPLGVLMTPLVGRVIDSFGAWPSLMATNLCGVIQGLTSTFLPLTLQPIAFALFGKEEHSSISLVSITPGEATQSHMPCTRARASVCLLLTLSLTALFKSNPHALFVSLLAVAVLYRTMLYSTIVAAVASLYGFAHLGRILGILFTAAAVASLAQVRDRQTPFHLHQAWPMRNKLRFGCSETFDLLECCARYKIIV
jgi:hypothetical protein